MFYDCSQKINRRLRKLIVDKMMMLSTYIDDVIGVFHVL